jgi:hypothetical protein
VDKHTDTQTDGRDSAETDSGAMTHIASFINFGSGIQMLIEEQTHTGTHTDSKVSS